jgi:hypothetical protein
MGKLHGMRVYMVGAMDRVPDGGAGWRQDLIPKLHDLGVMVYNPCNKPIVNPQVLENKETRQHIEELKKNHRFEELRNEYKQIRNVDLRMVDTSDFIIANIDVGVHACGTYEEIVTANRQKKPILVHVEQGVENIPNWLAFMLPSWFFFSNWNDLLSYLEDINSGDLDDDTNRWVFFDMKKELEAIQ